MVTKNIRAVVLLATGILFCALPVTAAVILINPGDSIQLAVSGALDGDVIVLNPGMYSQNGITITGKSLTFRAAAGHNATDTIIDGKSTPPRILTITDASSLTIENLTLRNSRAGNGAGGGDTFWGDGGNGFPGQSGGAIWCGGPVTLISSVITGCIAGSGGGGGDAGLFGDSGNGGGGGNGGAVYVAGPITLISSTISASSAGDGGGTGKGGSGNGGKGGSGGAIFSGGTVTLNSSGIYGCQAGRGGYGAPISSGSAGVGGDGGAISSAGEVFLSSTAIDGCVAGKGGRGAEARKGGHGGNGGAINTPATVSITSSTITNCSSGTGGTGGFAGEGGDGGNGGAVYAAGVVTVAFSNITRCSAGSGGQGTSSGVTSGNGGYGGNGGGIYSPDTVSLAASTLTECSAGTGGSGSNADEEGWGFFAGDGGHGRPGGNGGAVFSGGGISITSSSVTDCRAGTGGSGGRGGTFHQNGHTGASGTGGAAYASTGTVRFSRITRNNAVGGAVVSSGGVITATPNWWGSNSNPSSQVGGPVTYTPWLVFKASAVPAAITVGQSSAIRTSLTSDSDGAWHDPAGDHVPDGIPVSYKVSSPFGTVTPGLAWTVDGASEAVFSTPSGLNTVIITSADGETIPVTVIVSRQAPLPAVIGISPASGPATGGTVVNINGIGLSDATSVRFGTTPVSFTIVGESLITATSPASGSAGTVDIMVTTPAGTSPVVPADRFTFIAVPTTVPTKVPTTYPKPTKVPTTYPTIVPTTNPAPEDIIGCWYLAYSDDAARITNTYAFLADGTGWMNGTRTIGSATETSAQRIRWSMDTKTAVVTVTSVPTPGTAGTGRWVLTYVKKTDVLDGGEKGAVILIFHRIPCRPVG